MVKEPLEKQQFGVTGIEIDVSEDALLLHAASKRRISENDIVMRTGILAVQGCGERVVMVDVGALQLVQVEIEDGDLHHVGVVVEASERMLFEKLPLLGLEQAAVHDATGEIGGLGVLPQDVVVGGNQEARRAARGIADAHAWLADSPVRRSNQ